MPIVYKMTAEENYPPSFVAAFNVGNQPYFHEATYQANPGSTFDYVRRQILYNASVFNDNTETNTTGFKLWSGQNLITTGGTIDKLRQKNLQICQKNVDSGSVTWNDCYNAANTVPNGLQVGLKGTIAGGSGYVNGVYVGVPLTGGSGTGAFANIRVSGGAVVEVVKVYNPNGGYAVSDVLSASNTHLGGSGSGFTYTVSTIAGTSDGTFRRFVESQGNAYPMLIDPRSGDTWVHAVSSAAADTCTVHLFRASDNYTLAISPLLSLRVEAHMQPIGISDTWTYIVEYKPNSEPSNYHISLTPRTVQTNETAADFLLTYANYDFPTAFNTMYEGPNAFVFTKNQTAYFLNMQNPGTRAYKLYRFDEPSSAPYGGPIVGGGFTDVTPWSSSTGPNTNAAAYIYNDTTGLIDWGNPTNNFLYYLPIQNQVAIVSKFFSWQTSNTLVTDPTLTFFDLTYYNITGATFDYHHAFVRGYMSAAWTPLTSSTGAAWIVIDALQMNAFASHNTYVFTGYDYTKVWFAFVVQPYDPAFAGPDQSKLHTIFVQYQLAYGSAPTVLQVVDEAGWDAQYFDYGVATRNPNVVWNSQGVTNKDQISDAGIYDDAGKAIWWGGSNALYNLNLALLGPRDSAPFLKLQFYDPGFYCVPFVIGKTFTSQGQILRPASPQEAMTQSGPAQGKYRRMTDAMPLLFDAQGVSMGVDFLTMRPLKFFSPGGTVPIPLTQTFSGVYKGQVDASSNFDNMWCWEITRPYPCTVVSVECQLETNENL